MGTVPSPVAVPPDLGILFSLRVDEIAGMLNFELADHPVYEGAELQWFDDDHHGTGMLVFLARRDDRRVDYYVQPGLRLDRSSYELAGGTGSWTETEFDVARFAVAGDGVAAEVAFADLDGRRVEIRVDDRDGRVRRRGGLLAPVGAAIERPTSLLLVWMPRFDLVRAAGHEPAICIDGVAVRTGRLPGQRLHHRQLVKYAAPVITVELNRTPLDREAASPDHEAVVDGDGRIRGIVAARAGHRAEVRFDPTFPVLSTIAGAQARSGRWTIGVDGNGLTGGTWSTRRRGPTVTVDLDVDQRWKPGRLPWLMRLVTTVVPVFRRWPTTYRWRAMVDVDQAARVTARWERTGGEDGRGYRRATGS